MKTSVAKPKTIAANQIDNQPTQPHSQNWLDQGIETVLVLAVALTPLLFSPLSRELFEFPKMIWVYLLAIIGLALILGKSIAQRKFTIPTHPLNRPLVVYGLVFIISTLISLNLYTSVMGYYSRFHGGLASLAAYLVLFYLVLIYLQALPTRAQRTARLLWSWVIGSIIVSAWAIGEHFGYSPSCWLLRGELNADCWVQDVQARVFATFGQPNWLAAYLITTIPVSLALLLQSSRNHFRLIAWLGVAGGYAALWYTYSRSGWIGLAVALIVLLPWAWRIKFRQLWPWLGALIVVCGLVSLSSVQMANQRTATALESGNFDSSTGQIRLLVWEGSLKTALDFSMFGSGPETFPYSFLNNRPAVLNRTSEWNFLYNKAHNEVLQVAVTIGIMGLIVWLFLYFKLFQIAWQQKIIAFRPKELSSSGMVPASLLAGIVGVFAAQLLGFSVVVTALYFWLAAAIILAPATSFNYLPISLSWRPILSIAGTLLTLALILSLGSYYFAEFIATQASSVIRTNPWQAEQQLRLATKLNPFEPTYQQQSALANAYLAQLSTATELADHYATQADQLAQQAYQLNPHHILNLKGLATVYQQLGNVDQKYLEPAIALAQEVVGLDPTDANAQQTLAQLYLQNNQNQPSLDRFNTVIELRPQSANSYLQRAQYYTQTDQADLAIQDLMLAQTLEPDNRQVAEQLQLLQGK